MENMVAESVKYSIVGMGIVFLFLYTLVLLLRLQKVLIAKFFAPERVDDAVAISVRKRNWDGDEIRRRRKKTAAIIAAVHHYKKV